MKLAHLKLTVLSVIAPLAMSSCSIALYKADPSQAGTAIGNTKIQGLAISSVVELNKFDGVMEVTTAKIHREAASSTIAKLAGAAADIALGTAAIRHSSAALKEARAYEQIANDGIRVNNNAARISLNNNSFSSSNSSARSSSTSFANATGGSVIPIKVVRPPRNRKAR